MELVVLPRVGFFGAALLSGFSGFSGGLITSNAVIAYSVSNGTRETGSVLTACVFSDFRHFHIRWWVADRYRHEIVVALQARLAYISDHEFDHETGRAPE